MPRKRIFFVKQHWRLVGWKTGEFRKLPRGFSLLILGVEFSTLVRP